jgi:NADH-quinone oxidoreductase subunit D/NADH-quinone oxidoreductase subunit C/D
MTDQPAGTTETNLAAQFPEWVKEEQRPGYKGYVVAPEHLKELAIKLRDEMDYESLSSVTGVDYLAQGQMEVVYHLRKLTGGEPIELKVQLPRENPVVDSLVPVFPGADFQEREAWDLLGIRFEGHPDLRRILTWEGFNGHPLRKDWKEPYYEEDVKPYKSRWPEGKAVRAETTNPFGDNVQFEHGFNPDTFIPDDDNSIYSTFNKSGPVKDGEIDTDHIIVNLGPQHPSTHGVFRMVAEVDGETVVDLKPVMGYMHRNHEKIGERNTYMQNMPYTDRLDYICSLSNNFGYALAVEKMINLKPTERADYLRVIMAELTRISNHLLSIGFLLNDLGAMFTPVLYAFEERELILDIFEAVTGSRMMCNYFRFGGVAHDLPEGMAEHIKDMVFNRLPRKVDELDALLTTNEIVKTRTQDIGVLTAQQAIAFSTVGPVLRASGIPYDLRRANPYSIYDRFDFDVCVRYHGDIYDRYLLRLDEIRQSIRIIQQAITSLPEGPIQTGKSSYQIKVPAGESYGTVEGPKGELGFYLVSDGKANPYRYHVRAPTFINLTPLGEMCKGGKIADAVTILGSIDIVLGEVDR